MCGLEGCKPENAGAIEELIISVIRDVADNGVAYEKVAAVLHQLELSQREVKGDGYPYGLQLILEGLSAAIHRGDPVALLNIDPVLDQLRQEIKDPNFIKSLARGLLVNNPHRVRLVMSPDPGLSAAEQRAEADRLEALRITLSGEEKQKIIQQAKNLSARQESEDDPEILPKVGTEDVPAHLTIPEGTNKKTDIAPLTFFGQGTNGIAYQQIITHLPALDSSEISSLPLYTRCLTELGVGDRDYLATQSWQDAVSGGINATTSIRGTTSDIQALAGYFTLSGKSLSRNHKQLTDLIKQTFSNVRFDELERIRDLIAQDRARAEQSVTGNGHVLAMSAACSGMSPVAAMSHELRGLEGILSLKRLDDSLNEPDIAKRVVDGFASIHKKIIHAPRQFFLIGEPRDQETLQQDILEAWQGDNTPEDKGDNFSLPSIRKQIKQFWVTSTQVNFCAKAYPTVPVDHKDAAALSVLGGFLRNGYLHRAIREQGGAYGGGAGQDSDIGAFRFYSYRDPRLVETLHDFDKSIDWLLNEKHDPRQLEEAILGVISGIDKPGSPAGEAKKAFYSSLFGRTPEQRRDFRRRVLEVTLHDLVQAGETYLKPELASIAVISNTETQKRLGDLGLQVKHL